MAVIENKQNGTRIVIGSASDTPEIIKSLKFPSLNVIPCYQPQCCRLFCSSQNNVNRLRRRNRDNTDFWFEISLVRVVQLDIGKVTTQDTSSIVIKSSESFMVPEVTQKIFAFSLSLFESLV
jgi:hypothetical protein